jgi:hypothetical protein
MPFSASRIVVIFSLAAAALASAEMTFSVKTNSDFPTLGTDFGYKAGKLEPYLGVSNYSFRVKSTRTYTPSEAGTTDKSSSAATLFITSLGLRVGLRDEGVKPYFFANVYKLFTILDLEGNSPEEDDEIEKMYSPWGLGGGFGAEYLVGKGFSVFGEYGIRALFPSSKQEYENFDSVETDEEDLMLSAMSGSAGIRFAF